MNSTELLDLFRDEMSDAVAPYLWSDALVYGYMQEAQTEFCRRTDGIADARTLAVTRLNLVPGTDWYDTDPTILELRKVTRLDDGRPIDMLTAEQADSRGVQFAASITGRTRYLVTGLAGQAVRVAPMPSEGLLTVSSATAALGASTISLADTTGIVAGMGLTAAGVPAGTAVLSFVANTSVTLSAPLTAALPLGSALAFGTLVALSVYRLPLDEITSDGDQALEIDTQHHMPLLDWMKSRAFDKQDAETVDRRKSSEYRDRFLAYCARAKQEQQRARRVQGNVAYGGI